MSKALSNRMKGQLPLSIATSIAFESLLNMEPPLDAPVYVRRPKGHTKPIVGFEQIWINLRTLIRNIDGAIDNNVNNDASPMDYYRVVLEEMAVIQNIVNEINDVARPEIHYYMKNYDSLTKVWRHALFREVTAPRLKVYAALENNILTHITEDIKRGILSAVQVHSEDCYATNTSSKAALISHFPVDLILVKGERFAALVESHTGAIKKREEWNTKFRDGSKYPRIPFDRGMIQIFGDKENMLSPQTLKIRQRLAAISEKYQWNALTTRERIIFCVEQEHEPVLLKLIKDCYRS
jgi:hypothetical protein